MFALPSTSTLIVSFNFSPWHASTRPWPKRERSGVTWHLNVVARSKRGTRLHVRSFDEVQDSRSMLKLHCVSIYFIYFEEKIELQSWSFELTNANKLRYYQIQLKDAMHHLFHSVSGHPALHRCMVSSGNLGWPLWPTRIP